MQVVVKPYLFLREELGFLAVSLQLPDRTTVGELLDLLENKEGLRYPASAATDLVILVDGRSVRQLSGLDTPLREGAVVSLFPPATGG